MTHKDALGAVDAQIDRKISLRLLPFLSLLMFVAFIDRIAISYAGPNGMNEELGLTATAFGFAAGIFFAGYILVEVPSNIAMHRFGGRAWLARIITTWGIVQTLTAFSPNAPVLYALRFLLGVAEAGFAPGVMLYLTLWFSHSYRGRAVSRFFFSTLVATVVGAPLSLWLISFGDGSRPLGLVGWRFLYVSTGVVAVILGVIAWFYLDDRPDKAKWLSADEKARIRTRLEADRSDATPAEGGGILGVFKSSLPWLLGLCYFTFVYGAYALTFFLPTIVSGFEEQFGVRYSSAQVALLTSVPFCFGGAAQLWLGRRADKKGRLGLLVAATAVIGLVGGVAATFASDPLVLILFICLLSIGTAGGATTVLIMATRMYSGVSAATAIALVNTVGISAGFFGPYLTGWLRDATGNDKGGILLIALLLALSAVIALMVDRPRRIRAGGGDSLGLGDSAGVQRSPSAQR
ncbi:MFS transporter [Actinomadura rugatobispora]|uniref:MFS transporter n=1 Tax=Actinomadura rugatobispora TaxID=1994 RepID=A0ABW1A5M6_9ACTN|nr:MFS transporter [Actinomadura rugatobispora]